MVEWAPLNVPLRRRLQTLSVFIFVFMLTYGMFVSYLIFVALLFTRIWWLNVIYIFYALNNNGLAGFYDNYRTEWFRNLSIWRYAAEYFPIKVVKTVELDPSKNYYGITYPHGLLMSSICFMTSTNAVDFHKIFPGIRSTVATIPYRFGVPFEREMLVLGGSCIVTEESLLYHLDDKKHKGNLVVMNTGASSEIFINKKDEYNLYIQKRRGYARIALKSGASLVPIFCFGENKMFDGEPYPPGTFMRKIQDKIRKVIKVAIIPPKGRGFFQYSYGMIPHRIPINIVVGAPLEVPKILDPTPEQMDEVHNRFLKAVRDLFDEHKHKYESDPNIPLNFC